MNNAFNYNLFANIISSFLFKRHCFFDHVSDASVWNDIFKEFMNHSISTLAVDAIGDIDIPNDIKSMWKNEIVIQSSQFIKILNVQNDITKCLNSQNIKWAVIKGLSVALYYSNPYQRTIGDIDIIVKEEDFDKAKEALSDAGFVFGKNIYRYDRHITARKNGIELELHRFFANTRSLGNDKFINQYIFDALENIRIKNIGNTSFNVLPDVENGLVIIEHISHHMATGIGLRHIIDFVVYVDKILNDDFWEHSFKEIAKKLECDVLCKAIARIGQMYFDIDNSITWCKDIDDSIVNDLFCLIIKQGDFGAKTARKRNRTVNVFNKAQEGLFSFFKYEQASGMINWKYAQKHKFLQPLAWLYGICRHITKAIFNRDDVVSLKTNYTQSKKQSKLLKKLK